MTVALFDDYNHIVRLSRGERLMSCLEQFVRDTELPGAWVSGLGAVSGVTLGFYDLETKSYQWRTFSRQLEITSLQGNIAFDVNKRPVFHIHGTFSSADFQTIGGHIKDFVVGGTCELFVHHTYRPLRRVHDDDVGLELLEL